jgi:hypothetical protein
LGTTNSEGIDGQPVWGVIDIGMPTSLGRYLVITFFDFALGEEKRLPTNRESSRCGKVKMAGYVGR